MPVCGAVDLVVGVAIGGGERLVCGWVVVEGVMGSVKVWVWVVVRGPWRPLVSGEVRGGERGGGGESGCHGEGGMSSLVGV